MDTTTTGKEDKEMINTDFNDILKKMNLAASSKVEGAYTAPSPELDEDGDSYFEDPTYDKYVTNCNEEFKQKEEDKMHLKEVSKIAEAYSEEEAKIIVDVFMKKYPDAVFNSVFLGYHKMEEQLNGIRKLIGGRFVEREY